ncbi:MAG: LysR family transcriptional regulator [Deltaproteobacteria bacterium]|nr:LysR family transcriptional regulator [Deltaproteobacteria bacterium]
MNIGYKIWLEKEGKAVFGMGIYKLLCLVDETGSLHKAALDLKMSYRAAWGKVRDYEDRMGIGLLEKGRHGRIGAQLTPEGKVVLKQFQHLMRDMQMHIRSDPVSGIVTKIDKLKAGQTT